MDLVLRADGGTASGFGHLARVTALGTAARRRGLDVLVVTNGSDPAAEAFVIEQALVCHAAEVASVSTEDASLTRALAGDTGVIVVDGYGFTSDWLASLSGAERRVVYIDDLYVEGRGCDFVVNTGVGASVARYPDRPPERTLAGPEFAIVHDRFLQARAARPSLRSEHASRVLVTMGGSDPPGVTLLVLEALALIPSPLEVIIIVGAANRRRNDVERVAAERSFHRIEVHAAVPDMTLPMLWADVVVTASGVTASEIACVGLPGVAIPIVDNQESVARALAERGMFEVVAREALEPQHIAAALGKVLTSEPLRVSQFERQRAVVDGLGTGRILSAVLGQPRR